MIPKIIHYCWLSGDPYPNLIQKCIDSWKVHLPDYEFMLWDLNRFDIESNPWVKEAFEQKKYAFAADYIRLYAVHTYGGIYLDTDVEVLKSFDSLLHLPYFIGSEGDGNIEAGVFGAEANCDWIADCLTYYKDRHFIMENGLLDTLTLPRILMAQISKNRIINEIATVDFITLKSCYVENELLVFPQVYFCAKNHGTGLIEKTNDTYCIHHFAMSWIPKKYTFLSNIKKRLIKVFGLKVISSIVRVFKLKELKDLFIK